MRSSKFFCAVAVTSLALAGLLVLAGCAAKTQVVDEWWGDPETGIVLEYRMPAGEALKYEVTNEHVQSMEVMGTSTDVTFDQHMTFTALPGDRGQDEQSLKVTVDDFGMDGASPQGNFSAAADHLAGMSFEMSVGPTGDETDCEGSEALTYEVPQSGEQDLSSQFCEFFPDLPEKPVMIGDSWESTTTLDEGNEENDVTLTIVSMNTLAGFETMGGRECARIETEFAGTTEGTGSQGPATFTITGDIEGSGTWHFAYREGIVVSDFSMGTSTGEIVVQGPQEMTIPMTRTFTMESQLVEANGVPVVMKKAAKPKPVEMTNPKPIQEPVDAMGMKPRMLTAGPFTVVGVQERVESTATATPELFQDIWTNKFMPHHDAMLAASTDKRYYGLSHPTGEGDGFYYVAGMAVPEGTEIPEGFTSVTVPLADYAVFETDMAGIGNTWMKIFTAWLPESGYVHPEGSMSYEEYPPESETDESSKVHIYVPVVKQK